jgi:hypothetical protein
MKKTYINFIEEEKTREFYERLLVHLSPLINSGKIVIMNDKDFSEVFNNTELYIHLVTPTMLAKTAKELNEFITKTTELKNAKHIPVMVIWANLYDTVFSKLQFALNGKTAPAVDDRDDSDSYIYELVKTCIN